VHSKFRTLTSVTYQPAGFYPLIKIGRMTCVMILGQPYKGVSSEWSPNDTKNCHSTGREKMIYISRYPQNVPSPCLPSHDTYTPGSQTAKMLFLHQIGFYWEFSLPIKCPQLPSLRNEKFHKV
jgi:hypothetical protein